MKRSSRNRESFNKKVMIIFFVLIFVWFSLAGAITLLTSAIRSLAFTNFGVFVLTLMTLMVLPVIPLFYVWNRFFKDAFSSFGTKKFQTCTFQGLGIKRQDYLDQLTRKLTEIDFKPINKSSLDSMEYFAFGGTDLVFKSPNKWIVGIRALSVKEDLKVGLISGGILRQLLLQYFAGLVLAIILFTIGGFGFKAVGLNPNTSAVIALVIFLTILLLTAFLINLQNRTVNRKVIKILIDIAQLMGSNQITPFKKTTIELEA